VETRRDMTPVRPSALLDHSIDIGAMKPSRHRLSRRRPTGHEIPQDTEPELRMSSGSTFRLELTGDVEIAVDDEDDDGGGGGRGDHQQTTMTFHELVGGSCRRLTLIPKSSVAADKDSPKVTIYYEPQYCMKRPTISSRLLPCTYRHKYLSVQFT